MAGRPWTQRESTVLRDAVRSKSTPFSTIARALDRTKTACYQQARRLRVYRRHKYARYGAEFERFLRDKNAQGYSDPDIADAWGGERHAVSRRRNRLGLPSQAKSPRQRRQWRKMVHDQCLAAGVKNLAELRVKVWQDRAVAQGWPADCTPVMCQILAALEYRPRTRREMCAILRRPYHPQHALRNGPGQTLTAVLMAKGYVAARGRRPFRKGKGNTEFVYALAPGFHRRRVSGVA